MPANHQWVIDRLLRVIDGRNGSAYPTCRKRVFAHEAPHWYDSPDRTEVSGERSLGGRRLPDHHGSDSCEQRDAAIHRSCGYVASEELRLVRQALTFRSALLVG